MSVETGILERLYDLGRGTTEALVANGFLEDLVSHSTNIEPARLIDILRDREAAVQLVIDCATNNREPTKGLLHELHIKERPNNPKRPDRAMHRYCPPVHVDSEIDNLLAGYHNTRKKIRSLLRLGSTTVSTRQSFRHLRKYSLD